MIAMSSMTAGQNEMELFSVGAILTALFWSTPIGLLIWFLNRQKIKKISGVNYVFMQTMFSIDKETGEKLWKTE